VKAIKASENPLLEGGDIMNRGRGMDEASPKLSCHPQKKQPNKVKPRVCAEEKKANPRASHDDEKRKERRNLIQRQQKERAISWPKNQQKKKGLWDAYRASLAKGRATYPSCNS